MRNYAVFLHGENFDIHYAGKRQPVGFFTTVRVEAESKEAASRMAIEVIKSDHKLSKAYTSDASTKPDLNAKVVHELEPSNKMKNTSHTFYGMDEI